MLVKPVLLHFKFDDFANEYYITYNQEDCNGNTWKIGIVRCVDVRTWQDLNTIDFYLRWDSGTGQPLGTNAIVSVKNASGETVKERKIALKMSESGKIKHFMEYSKIIDESNNILKEGSLCVDVTIQVKDKKTDELCEANENRQHQKKMLDLLDNDEQADISATVGGELFHLHSLILENNAPVFAAYCKQSHSNGIMADIIHPKVFRMILEYVYAGCHSRDSDIVAFGKELIDAANRFELVELKLDIEKVLVRERILDKENVADFIVFADAKTCPLLKEYAIAFFLLHGKEILKSDHSKCLRESAEVLSEIMMLMFDPQEDGMTVNELRTELKKRKLDIDGSKEALMTRLNEAKRQRTE